MHACPANGNLLPANVQKISIWGGFLSVSWLVFVMTLSGVGYFKHIILTHSDAILTNVSTHDKYIIFFS